MNTGTARNTVGSLSPKNSNETDGEVQRQPGSWQAQAGFPLM